VPRFPKIISISLPVDKRTGRYNPFYCFITVEAKSADPILAMNITSNGKKLKIALSLKHKDGRN